MEERKNPQESRLVKAEPTFLRILKAGPAVKEYQFMDELVVALPPCRRRSIAA